MANDSSIEHYSMRTSNGTTINANNSDIENYGKCTRHSHTLIIERSKSCGNNFHIQLVIDGA
jgi:hypothetical protein